MAIQNLVSIGPDSAIVNKNTCHYVVTLIAKIFIIWSTVVTTTSTQNLNISDIEIALTPERNYSALIVPKNTLVKISLIGVNENMNFVVVEAHSIFDNVTISYSPQFRSDESVTSAHAGLVVGLPVSISISDPIYLLNQNLYNVQVLVKMNIYSIDDPVPGACSMEEPIKVAPYLPLKLSQHVMQVNYPLASWPVLVKPTSCDRFPLEYNVFIRYLPEGSLSLEEAFKQIVLMSGVESIEANGHQVLYYGSPKNALLFANYPGTGRIVSVIVRSLTSSSAYVSTLSYGCEYSFGTIDLPDCRFMNSLVSRITGALLFFIGAFLLLVGHRFFKILLFMNGMIATCLTTFLLSSALTDWSELALELTTIFVGALGGLFILCFWGFGGSPIIPSLLASLQIGTLFASILSYTPLGDMEVLKYNEAFWLAFVCASLVIVVVIMLFTRLPSILFATVIGSTLVILPVDHYFNSNLMYILLNLYRRMIVPNFHSAIISPPFQSKDFVLTIVWVSLAILGTLFQFYRERRRAPFPPAIFLSSNVTTAIVRRIIRRQEFGVVGRSQSGLIADENTPLIR